MIKTYYEILVRGGSFNMGYDDRWSISMIIRSRPAIESRGASLW